MVEANKRDNSIILQFSDEECANLGLKKEIEYELSKARDGIWVMVEGSAKKKEEEKQVIDEIEQKLMGYLAEWPLGDRVEGKFEKKIKPIELKKLEELLKTGVIEKFKLNESYKVPVYRVKPVYGVKKKFENKEKPFEEYTLEKDGFVVVKNELRAKSIGEELKEQIKNGEIKGQRSFNGEFYIIYNSLLESSMEKILSVLKKTNPAHISKISEDAGLTKTLVKITIEFLKEEGQVLEKKKEF